MLQSLPMQIALVALSAVGLAWYYPDSWSNLRELVSGSSSNEEGIPLHYESSGDHETLFTRDQLAKYNGEDGAPIYLAILGSVYDVSKGVKHYGPGCSYNFFAGRDASVSFVTGEFEHYDPAAADDVITLQPSELLSLANWKRFYDTDYTYKGKLVGRYFNAAGQATPYRHKFDALVEQAAAAKAATEKLRAEHPDCNIEWSEDKGTRVWCTTKSGGGAERSWAGHPRKLYVVGAETFRCACIKEELLGETSSSSTSSSTTSKTKTMWIPYDNCEPLAHECFYLVN